MELLKNAYSLNDAHKVEGYPYGFKAKTTAFFYLEKDKRGFHRSVFQTINTKTGELNKPKKSIYCAYIRMYKDELGHICYYHYNTYSPESFVKARDLGIFETDAIRDSLGDIIRALTIQSLVVYRGHKIEDIKNLSIDELAKLSE